MLEKYNIITPSKHFKVIFVLVPDVIFFILKELVLFNLILCKLGLKGTWYNSVFIACIQNCEK